MRPLRAAGVCLVLTFVAACGGSDAAGTVGGAMPACYGPGPDLNLIPTRSIEVYRDGTLVKNETFPSDRDHQTYELTLPAGRYSLKVSGIAPIEVRVSPHQHAVLDLPLPACL